MLLKIYFLGIIASFLGLVILYFKLATDSVFLGRIIDHLLRKEVDLSKDGSWKLIIYVITPVLHWLIAILTIILVFAGEDFLEDDDE